MQEKFAFFVEIRIDEAVKEIPAGTFLTSGRAWHRMTDPVSGPFLFIGGRLTAPAGICEWRLR